jgi:hypothetical protein
MSDGADELLKLLSDMIASRQMATNVGLGDVASKGPNANPSDIVKGYREVTNELKQLLALEKDLSKERREGAKKAAAEERRAAAEKKSAHRAYQAALKNSGMATPRDVEIARRRSVAIMERRAASAAAVKAKALDAWEQLAYGGTGSDGMPRSGGGVGGGRAGGSRAKGLGRLPLASVPAALMGNRSAGARVGYALGSMTGLGMAAGLPGLAIGAGAAAAIGAGGAASPTGMSVVTKPLEILAGTIGGMVLPSLVRFGGALLDMADWVEGKMGGKEATPGSYSNRANQVAGAYGGAGVLAGATIGSIAGPPGMVIGALTMGIAGLVAGKKIGDMEADARLKIDPSPEAAAERQERFGGKLQSLSNQKMILQDMIQGLGAKPKMGSNILDIAKETQMAVFESPMEVRQRRMWMENIAIVSAKIEAVEKAIRGG